MDFDTVLIGSLSVNEGMIYTLILPPHVFISLIRENGIYVRFLLRCNSLRQLINEESHQHINEHATIQQQP